MRPALLALALGLGAAASCYTEEFLLGAYCDEDDECGADQCCTRFRCRPQTGTHCSEAPTSNRPYEWAYMACGTDDECLVRGMPRCVVWQGAALGFCADLCHGDATDCPIHPGSYNRTCVDFDDQRTCALACGAGNFCPVDMRCLEGLCVPDDT
jgi:hypothetical protein